MSEPDRLASGFGPGMRALITRDGLERTGLIQFGSRAGQRFLFKLKPGVDLDTLRANLKTTFPRINITDYREGSPAVGKALDNTTTFLSLTSLIALIVGSLGVAMAMYSHFQQRMDSIDAGHPNLPDSDTLAGARGRSAGRCGRGTGSEVFSAIDEAGFRSAAGRSLGLVIQFAGHVSGVAGNSVFHAASVVEHS